MATKIASSNNMGFILNARGINIGSTSQANKRGFFVAWGLKVFHHKDQHKQPMFFLAGEGHEFWHVMQINAHLID